MLDIVFPPHKEELALRSLTPKEFLASSPRSPQSPLPFVYPSLAYKNPLVRELVWQIKYRKNEHAVDMGAFILHKKIEEMGIKEGILVPIPISRKRRKERGFNQCELLVDKILEIEKMAENGKENGGEKRFQKDFGLLIRAKHIEKQTLKGRKDRLENIKNIFEVTKTGVQDKIILIDDVVTTGSTLNEARDTLMRNGYDDVTAVTIAH